jgi:osmoprotectant transport system substrate-binding protein
VTIFDSYQHVSAVVQRPSVTMKRAFFEANPEIAEVTAPVTAALTNDVIIELNKQVDVDGKDPSVVARDWMVARGFVTKAD